MKVGLQTISRDLPNLWPRFPKHNLPELPRKYVTDQPPLRSELFSVDQMEQHGKFLAKLHKVSLGRHRDKLLSRLAENESVLTDVLSLLMAAIKAGRHITPAGEWLLDNFYLIEEQIRLARRHLPRGYSQQLPRLVSGPSAGLPRVYDIALEIISHGDGRLDPESLSRFITAYQTVKPLKLGELWAIPIMLRLALIENLRRVGTRIAAGRIERDKANFWADQMMEIVEKNPNRLILIIADMARSNPPMLGSFVAELVRRLQGQSAALALPLTWIEQWLSESGLTIAQLVQSDAQQQAIDQVSVSNSIASLRFLESIDWQKFVEEKSIVEQTLLQDPSGIYGKMDFSTRDRYRHVLEKISKRTRLSEVEIAQEAVKLAQRSIDEQSQDNREAHVGFYIIDRGITRLEEASQVRFSLGVAIKRLSHRFALFLYLESIGLITVILSGGLLARAQSSHLLHWQLALIGILLLISTSQLAVILINSLVATLCKPQALPRMEFKEEIPAQYRTLVVVPTILSSIANVEALCEALEVRFLANRTKNLHFGLLTDFKDAQEETSAEDNELILLAKRRIEELNNRYNNSGTANFFLFHRQRKWNLQENIWMGYERKRGKLADLNAFLRGYGDDRFSLVVGDTKNLSSTKYVITLDTDTQLPRDTAKQFVGAMAHPLNAPRFDPLKKLVIEGYGILQSRVSTNLPGTIRSHYAQLNSSEMGIDPYTRTVSDVYQDLFEEGSFIGKGIYDIDAFEKALKDRFPKNRILSHDLLEGCYARSGLLSDVELYEEYPSSYIVDAYRRHRWIRGDWQLIAWLLPSVPGFSGGREINPLSALSRWKILDNLRRSLIPGSLLFLLLFSWTILSPHLFWTIAVLAIILVAPLFISVLELFRKPPNVLWFQHITSILDSTLRHITQTGFALACLPYEALFSFDAIVCTIVRVILTHKQLLQWNPSSELHHHSETGLIGICRTMWAAPVIAGMTIICLALSKTNAFIPALPIVSFWFVSPIIVWWLSLPFSRRQPKLTATQTIFLRKVSRMTWAFFENLVGPEDNWLPPDNYQEQRSDTVAHRTSPTNIGLYLLANLAAYDFGYISAGHLIERTTNTYATMESLERYKGHFYNWYDTMSLEPLSPAYISSVDSGNLAANLLTVRCGFLALADQPILSTRLFEAIGDTLFVLRDALDEPMFEELVQFENALQSISISVPNSLSQLHQSIAELTRLANQITAVINAGVNPDGYSWSYALARQCLDAQDELQFLAPWISLKMTPDRASAFPDIDKIPTLRQLAALDEQLWQSDKRDPFAPSASSNLYDELKRLMHQGSRRAKDRIAVIDRLAIESSELAQLEYDFLFDKARRLLAIGYNVDQHRLESGYYDLLASEARTAYFVAIAQGQLPKESWFALGRLLTSASGKPVLLSWSGSMFEYLMPLLLMPMYENTLLDETCKAAVQSQIDYGKKRGVPWGISESAYNTLDVRLNYQYRAFGVPGLGLKRGLSEDLVIAPYASALALTVAPEESCANLQKLASQGFLGKYGFYEAIDYTSSRLPRGQAFAIIHSFMTHHQGMSFLALAYLLLDRPMQKRFLLDPSVQATTMLLQERIPKATAFDIKMSEASTIRPTTTSEETPVRIFTTANTPSPEIQLLSNGRYHVVLSNSGSGYSRWQGMAVTRWREDTTLDNWGTFCYIRDEKSGQFWSVGYQPTQKQPETYEVIFSQARVEFRRSDDDFDTYCQVAVSSEDDVELRKVRITNRSREHAVVEITSYAEVVLSPAISDTLHPAFSNLFVQTEIIKESQAILCHRRPRSVDEQTPWMLHLMAVHGAEVNEISYETDRSQFIGRTRSLAHPQAMNKSGPLSGSQGSVLDPIVAVRYRITINPEESAIINIVTGIADTKDKCLGLIGKYQDKRLADRVFDLALTHSEVILRQLNATESDAQLYEHMANSIIYANSQLRADPSVLIKNRRGQSGLWGYAISGDFPIVLLQIQDAINIDLVRQLIQAHTYWRLKGLVVDLVIWNEDRAGYRQELQEQILGLIAAGGEAGLMDRPGGIFLRPAEQISAEDRILIQSVARIIISDSRGALTKQTRRRILIEPRIPRLLRSRIHTPEAVTPIRERSDLIFFNGYGGFTADGREYVITTGPEHSTPAPWVNVIANSTFGTVVSEGGVGYTWSENAHEFRLTPWYNDPVTDIAGEAIYLRDEETGYFWSPTPLPAPGATPYVSRHGFGYSVFEHKEAGIRSELWTYVALDAPIKFLVLKLVNLSGRSRRLSATGYIEWVLGDLRANSAMHVVTDYDSKTGTIFARNSYNSEFNSHVAFFDVDGLTRSVTGSRTEFLGRNGTIKSPAAMLLERLSGKVGAGLDPCAAIQIPFELADGQEREIVFRLGVGKDAQDANNIVQRFRGSDPARASLNASFEYWKHTLGAVHVHTPDQSLNVLANGWLLYQTMAGRLWARSGYYQSGGAFGFRDQLQDVMALIHSEPRLLREHILLCASRQFKEGDVQHWWHPPSGRGVRTHCSDDYLWLPLAACRYVLQTGDTGVLDEQIHFLEGRPVNPDEDSYYDLPNRSDEAASLYEHCVRAILRGLRFGEHGLPLMGTGDWNDGMNLVGKEGKGESVWLAFFLYYILIRFSDIARLHNDPSFAQRCEEEATRLRENIEEHAWDGEWYRRAYFDDGTPLGSASNPECQIDSIAQSWSVLSTGGDPERVRLAMKAVNEHLVRREDRLIRLLDPAFDKSDLNPGYIKGYVPGVRENGGQYTHSAIWTIMAFASLGDNRRAWELWSMINPVSHGKSERGINTYKVEPYVTAADVYALAPHTGRGGWTWYTGSAGWTYRLIIESLLGIRLEVNKLRLTPCLPPDWQSFKIHYRHRETVYHINVSQKLNEIGGNSVIVDGVEQPDQAIPLTDDRREHNVEIILRTTESTLCQV